MYYEHVIKELNKMVNSIDSIKERNVKINEEIKPDCVVFRKKSNELKKKINAIANQVKSEETVLMNSIKKKNTKKDWEQLLDFKLKIHSLDRTRYTLFESFKDKRKKHYEAIAPKVKEKRQGNKKIITITEDIFERIKKK